MRQVDENNDQPEAAKVINAVGYAKQDFRDIVESRIKELCVEQRELQIILDGLPSKLPPDINQALINTFFSALARRY
jgi:hypothetical protein